MDVVIEIVKMVFQIKHKHPELRICQILSNAAIKSGWNDNDLFYLSDKMLMDGLKILKDEIC